MRNVLFLVLVLSFSSAYANGGMRFHLDLGAPVWHGHSQHYGGYDHGYEYRGPVYQPRYYGPPPGGWNYYSPPVYGHHYYRQPVIIRHSLRWGGSWEPRQHHHRHYRHDRW